MSRSVLSSIIVVLALVDGLIHLYLAISFFHLQIVARNQLSYLFPLDFIGLVVLVALFLYSARSSLGLHRLVCAALIVYPIAEIAVWLSRNHPNPMGFLGDGTKAIEVVLLVLVIAHLLSLGT